MGGREEKRPCDPGDGMGGRYDKSVAQADWKKLIQPDPSPFPHPLGS